jgi:hypothetical protein
VFDAEMPQQRMDALKRKAHAYHDYFYSDSIFFESKWSWISKIDNVVEWMNGLHGLHSAVYFLSFLLFLGVFIYYDSGYEEFFGEKAISDGRPKELAPRIFVWVLRIFFLTIFFAGLVFFILCAIVKFFFNFIKFIVYLIMFIIEGCMYVHIVFCVSYNYCIFPIFFDFFDKYTERQIDVLLRRPVAADSSNFV